MQGMADDDDCGLQNVIAKKDEPKAQENMEEFVRKYESEQGTSKHELKSEKIKRAC